MYWSPLIRCIKNKAFQLLSKLITFSANSVVIRNLNPAIKGQIFLLELFSITIVYLSTECFRRACVRSSIDDSSSKNRDNNTRNLQKIINVSWISVPVGLVVSIIGYFIFQWMGSRNEEMDASSLLVFEQALKLYGTVSYQIL